MYSIYPVIPPTSIDLLIKLYQISKILFNFINRLAIVVCINVTCVAILHVNALK